MNGKGALSWFIAGTLVGFSVLASASIGLFTLLPALGFTLYLAVVKMPGAWMFAVGAGLTTAILWTRVLLDSDAPDDYLLPLLVSLAVAGFGLVMFFRNLKGSASGGAGVPRG